MELCQVDWGIVENIFHHRLHTSFAFLNLLGSPHLVSILPTRRTTCHDRPDADGFALQILKRRKISTEPARYKLLSAIPPTSNVVERLFSVARAVLRLERHRMPPLTLEMIYF
ncbi:hypothetical protein PPTG_15271 [Phytophthora nicotianae INRA-310]|uniref:HAT C-terminal dimerisation domain-containing protein n=1 Tax=Phytophthora nicotianae (strain INRA-310) TaxID=761204 RepID=W2PTY9_PHYN3|nr:hypothetical protein PPTG_15271 [Phytophthora nicotianae INRA-310]ETN04096.1 hypothetical protein PPTG_15271 [Phytophthora nicotianae INRA-310]